MLRFLSVCSWQADLVFVLLLLFVIKHVFVCMQMLLYMHVVALHFLETENMFHSKVAHDESFPRLIV